MDADLSNALSWVSAAVVENTGHPLRGPEIVILKGTWRGLTYEQMAEESEYSTNYLMRDVAPKLWRYLSKAFGKPVGKTNFRIVLETYVRHDAQKGAQKDIQKGVWTDDQRDVRSRIKVGTEAVNIKAAAGVTRPMSRSVRQSPLAMSSVLYGYDAELDRVKQWLEASLFIDPGDDANEQLRRQRRQSALVGVWGLKGAGKSLFCEGVVAQVGDLFETVVWRSLKRKPTLTTFCSHILSGMGDLSPAKFVVQPGEQPMGQRFDRAAGQAASQAASQTAGETLEQAVGRLLAALTAQPTLLVIEGVEAILRSGALVGDYQSEYRAYDEFFQAIADTRSCLLLTGTESPAGWVNHVGHQAYQHSIYLKGLSMPAATALLENESLSARDHWPELITRYQGHPSALLSAARVIREMFNSRVDTFLLQASPLFTDILRLLTPTFERLSEQELNILYWLASQREPLSLQEIQQTLPSPVSSTELVSALDSLKQRFYLFVQTTSDQLETDRTANRTKTDRLEANRPEADELETAQPETDWPKFQLPPLIKAYAVYQLMAQFKRTPPRSTALISRGGIWTDAVSTAFSPERIINLSSPSEQPVQLSQWFHGYFNVSWQPLSQLLETSAMPSLRLRSTYHLRDETFIKRCKSVSLSVMYKNAHLSHNTEDYRAVTASAILVMAIREEAEKLYKVCVQVQPSRGSQVLPEGLELRLMAPQKTLLAKVQAVQADTFIQLPYFQGQISESFEIELALNESQHTETFFI
ncbi:MAG: DUF1822 family protein [Cyanobacteria bacterium J06623_5]